MEASQDALLKFRLDRELLARIDAEAARAGVNRSAWLRAVVHSVLGSGASEARPRGARSLALKRVYCGVPEELLRKIDVEAEATGLRRNVFIRRVLHSYLYEGVRFRVLSNKTDKQFATLKSKLSAVQRMVNGIQKAVRAIVRDGKYAELERRVDDLLAMDENLTAAFTAVESFVGWVTFEEHRYWRGEAAEEEIERHRELVLRASDHVELEDDEDLTGGFSEDEVGAGD